MKYIFLYNIILCISLSCSSSKQANRNRDDSLLYKVYKIDSIHSYYLIYAKKSDTLYKIVSKKEPEKKYNQRIKVGKYYDFVLYSVWKQKIMIGNVDVSPYTIPNATCLSFDDSTDICLEKDSINDLFIPRNVYGLYINKGKH